MASQKMHREQKVSPKISSARRRTTLSKVALEHMVDEATVDAYGESEQACGFYTMLENDLELPFNTAVLGADVTVERIDLADDHIVAVCRRGQERQRLPHSGSATTGASAQRMGVDRSEPALGKVGAVGFRVIPNLCQPTT
jgi:Calcium binding